jgi:hypothetical protein
MWQIYGSEIGRFSILVLASLVIFGLFWLYFDAWLERKEVRTIPLLSGLLLLSISFLLQGLNLETNVLKSVYPEIIAKIYLYTRFVAYILVILGLLLTPIEDRPKI